MKRALTLVIAFAACAVALVLAGCSVPAAGVPVLYADQTAELDVLEPAVMTPAKEAEEPEPENFAPAAWVGAGSVTLWSENRLGATITSISVRPSGSQEWPEETHYTGLSIPNGAQYVQQFDLSGGDTIDIRFEGTDGTTFLLVGCKPASLAADRMPATLVELRYDRGVAYVQYTNKMGATIDTRLSAQEALASMHAQLDSEGETFTFIERDLEGVEAGQETENCLD